LTRSEGWRQKASQEFRCNFRFLLRCFVLFYISLNTKVHFTKNSNCTSTSR
jgi:hypothetical protein